MINQKIVDGIKRRFDLKDCTGKPFPVVIWQNVKDGFSFDISEYAGELSRRGIELVNAGDKGPLWIKNYIFENHESRRAIYIDQEPSSDQRDPLLDLKLSYPVFTADQWSLFLDEAGLGSRPDLIEYAKKRSKFLSHDAYRERLRALITNPSAETETTLDLKVLATVFEVDDASIHSILMKALIKSTPDHDVAAELSDLELNQLFQDIIAVHFGYQDQEPALVKFVRWLLINDLLIKVPVAGTVFTGLRKGDSGASFRFCEFWRNSINGRESYKMWSSFIQNNEKDSFEKLYANLDLEHLQTIKTFTVELKILSRLAMQLTKAQETGNTGELRRIADAAVARKRYDFWLDQEMASIYQISYYACYHAACFFESLALFHPEGISDQQLYLKAYIESWSAIDLHYRLFFEAVLSLSGIDTFATISSTMQSRYRDQFLSRLAARWVPLISAADSTIRKWNFPELRSQNDFFGKEVNSYLETGRNRRIYVIISDALRYEVGIELTEILSANQRISASIKPMITNLPSITKIGMSALLPGSHMSFSNPETIMLDGLSTQGMEMRNKILNRSDGLAVGADELLALKREEARALQKNASIVYVYHDTIDAAGDKASSEDSAFTACRTACNDLEKIVKFIMNTMNGSCILITSDHGFIYTTDSVSESQRASVPPEIPGTSVNKKRYKLGSGISPCPGAITGSCSDFGFPESPVQFMVPNGIQLFHFIGGSKFFHGGLMPQEIIVPLITVKTDNETLKNDRSKNPVEAGVLGLPSTITTRIVAIRIFQADAVSENTTARTVTAGIFFHGLPVSDVQEILLNSASSNTKDLTKQIRIHLTGEQFDQKTDYSFILRDADTDAILYEQSVRISLMILDEF